LGETRIFGDHITLSLNQVSPACTVTLLYFYFARHEFVRDIRAIKVEQLEAPISKWMESMGRFVGISG
jgi:hypothetical protein